MEHNCPKCGLLHEGSPLPDIWHSRCSSCGALNREPQGVLAETACRRCDKVGQLVALDDIPEAVTRYPHLAKTERGYEYVAPAT